MKKIPLISQETLDDVTLVYPSVNNPEVATQEVKNFAKVQPHLFEYLKNRIEGAAKTMHSLHPEIDFSAVRHITICLLVSGTLVTYDMIEHQLRVENET